MKKWLVLSVFLVSFQASAFWCTTFDKALNVGTVSIASILECENKDIIKLDLVSLFNYDYFCGEQVYGPVCSLIAEAVANSLPHVVPERWGCKLDLASRITRIGVETICQKY